MNLVVARPHRLSRSLQDFIATVADLRRRSAGVRSLREALDTTTPGRLVFHVFAALAEFIRELIGGPDTREPDTGEPRRTSVTGNPG